MPADEVVDLGLAEGVQVLELVQRGELLHVQAVRSHDVRLPGNRDKGLHQHVTIAGQPALAKNFELNVRVYPDIMRAREQNNIYISSKSRNVPKDPTQFSWNPLAKNSATNRR